MKMNDIDEIIRQFKKVRIGVYYVTALWASELLEGIVHCFGEEQISRCCNGSYNKWIEFKNGDYIKFVPASDFSRGNKFDKAILEPGIPIEVFNAIIQPALIYRPTAIVLDGDDVMEARNYYAEQEEKEKC